MRSVIATQMMMMAGLPPTGWAVWNPADSAANIAITPDTLGSRATMSGGGPAFRSCRADKSFSVKTYIELGRDDGAISGAVIAAGLLDSAFSLSANTYSSIASNGVMSWGKNGNVYNNSSLKGVTGSGAPYIFGVAVDPATRNVWITAGAAGPGATWLGGGDPAAGTSPTCTLGGTGAIFPAACPFSNSLSCLLISDPAKMVGTAPSGFTAGL